MPPSSPLSQLPPQALEAEKALLGSMLIERRAVEAALEILREEDFYKDIHRQIFRAMLNIHQANRELDRVTLAEELKRLDAFGAVGGDAALSELIHSVSTAAHAEHYARLVHEKAILRELISAATTVVQSCFDEEKEPAVLLDEAQARVLAVAQKQSIHDFLDTKTLVHDVVEDIEMFAKRKKAVTGIPTGLLKFDKWTAGLQRGDLILIAARPGQGKTSLALNVAANVVFNEAEPRSVAFFSLEMTAKQLVMRLIAGQAKVNLHSLRTGYFPRDRWPAITSVAARLAEAPLYVVDTGFLSVLSLRSVAKRLARQLEKERRRLDLVIIDYLQLMQGASRRMESRQQEVAEISRGLKFLARDLNIPVVALSQLSRRVEEKGRADGKPQLSDLRESGALEQDADLVAFIYREGTYKDDPTLQDKAEIIIAKQRNGPTLSVPVKYLRDFTCFENLDEQDEAPAPAEEEEQGTFSLP
ncbi:MAG: replicative DNA helicase [Elusimicrobia bacterium]|nr:replicative DNA helicase [Elusimicrobiota bacterium]